MSVQPGPQHTVDDQVRIAADGRSEMGITRRRECEVAAVLSAERACFSDRSIRYLRMRSSAAFDLRYEFR